MQTFSIAVPGGSERSPRHVEQLLIACGPILKYRPIRFGYRRFGAQVVLTVTAHRLDAATLRLQLSDAFPDATIQRLSNVPEQEGQAGRRYLAHVWLKPDIFSLRYIADFEDRLARALTDPVTQILSALQGGGDDGGRIELRVRRASNARCRRAERIAASSPLPILARHRRLANRYLRFLTDHRRSVRLFGRMFELVLAAIHPRTQDVLHDETVLAKVRSPVLLESQLSIFVFAPSRKMAKERTAQIAGSFSVFNTGQCRLERGRVRQTRRTFRRMRRRGFLLTPEEAASLWHPPTSDVRVAGTFTSPFRQREPPANLPTPLQERGVATLGRVLFRSRQDVFGVRTDDRLRHIAILGKTGMGKSTLLESLITADIEAGRGVAVLDPHGDLAEHVLARVPRQRTNDVCYFDAGDRAYPIAFNPLACNDASQRPLVASGIVSAFKKLYGDSWGPRLEYILRNALLTLVETPGSSLASVLRLLSDARFRLQVVSKLEDSVVRGFWEEEFSRWKPQMQAEAISPIQNKIGQFIAHPILRNILGRPENRIDLRAFLDESKVLILNLSKGRIGEDASTLLGSLLVSQLQLAAMSRADVPEDARTDFFAYVDEFQNFATESFATILSEARKYRLSLTVANQYLAQLDDATLHALFGNVGTVLSFQVGAKDAEVLSEQLGNKTEAADLMALPKFTAYARLLIDGSPSLPFSMQTIAPRKARDAGRVDVIRKTSRHRYGSPTTKKV